MSSMCYISVQPLKNMSIDSVYYKTVSRVGVVPYGMSNSDKTTRASDLKTFYTPVFSKPNYAVQIMTI